MTGLIIIFWIVGGVFNAGFINAHDRREYALLNRDARQARDGLVFAIGWSVLFGPVAIIVTPFVTGFYQDGWTLECGPTK